LIEKSSFRYLVNSMQNQARSTNRDSAIDRSIAIDMLANVTEKHKNGGWQYIMSL